MISKEIEKWTLRFYRTLVVVILAILSIGPWYYIEGYRAGGNFFDETFICLIMILIGMIVLGLSFKIYDTFKVALVISVIALIAFIVAGIIIPRVYYESVMSKNWWLATVLAGVMVVTAIIGMVCERNNTSEDTCETKKTTTGMVVGSIYGVIALALVIVSIIFICDKRWKIKGDTLYIEKEIGVIWSPDKETEWSRYSFSTLKVEEGVKAIQYLGLSYNENFVEVELPKSLEIIGAHAFKDCKNLVDINIPQNVKKLEMCAFSGCVNLVEIDLPDKLEVIERLAFDECDKLEKIRIPKTVEEIGGSAFPKNTLLIVYKGSYAEKWAIENGYEYEIR